MLQITEVYYIQLNLQRQMRMVSKINVLIFDVFMQTDPSVHSTEKHAVYSAVFSFTT